MTPTRRQALAATAAAAAFAAVDLTRPAPARAASAPSGQVPGIYRTRVGDIVVTSINDGSFVRSPEGLVLNAEMAEVEQALEAAFIRVEDFQIPITANVVHTPSNTVLVDAATGGIAPTTGRFGPNMEAAGIAPGDVDTVLISHFHPDHIFGLVDASGAPVYGSAETVAVPAAEYAFWTDDANKAKVPEARHGLFDRARAIFGAYGERVRQFGDDEEIVPGIRTISAHGHTPGHTVFHLASGGDEMVILGDTANHPALFVANPGWHAAFDMDAQMAEATRRALFDRMVADRMLLTGYHFPFPAAGRIAKDGDGYAFVPAFWQPSL